MTLSLSVNGIGIPLKQFVFPGGEVGISFDPNNASHTVGVQAVISACLTSSNDIMSLFMLTDAVRRAFPGLQILNLIMQYVPYARQDRVMVPGESLSIKVFCDLINSQNYNSVTIWDPHSDVTPALLNNCVVASQESILHYINFEKKLSENAVLVTPDAGAIKKGYAVAKTLGITEVVRADKKRDLVSGKITETEVYSGHIGNKNFLIVDDIGDGGYTFLELAKVLRPLTNGKIILYVTHGIFSKGLEVFRGVIDEVWAANTFLKYPMNVELLEYTKPVSVSSKIEENQGVLPSLPLSKD